MLDSRSTKILLVILFLFLPQILFAQPQMKFACMSSWYEHCYMGICKDNFNKEPFIKKVKIAIDLSSNTLIRRTDNDYIMKITETSLRPENHIYISYEDDVASGFIVISLLNEEHAPVTTWKVKEAWPCKVEGPTLNSTGNEVAVESIELCHEGLTVEFS